MLRSTTLALAATAAVAVSACGSGGDSGGDGVTAGSAKASIERAAGLRLAAQPIPAEARSQGLRASFSNAPTAAKDHQVVFLFLMKDASVAGKVRDMVRASVPKPSQLLVHGKVLVVYAANGSDHAAQVRKAVDAF